MTTGLSVEEKTISAQGKAFQLFQEAKKQKLIQPGKTEKQLSDEVYQLADELFGVKKYWHKRIVRSGLNTLETYSGNPPNLIIQDDDIVFFDFGPIFDSYEADLGRTYVLGQDSNKLRLQKDLECIFIEGKQFYKENPELSGHDFYGKIVSLSEERGWQYGNSHCGHLIGEFSHERRCGELPENYICTDNLKSMDTLDRHGEFRHWILEIHLVDPTNQWGGFYEDLLTL